MLEEDADMILKFMASNGLVANPKKTVFMLLNFKDKCVEATPMEIRVGENVIAQSQSTKLLGVLSVQDSPPDN